MLPWLLISLIVDARCVLSELWDQLCVPSRAAKEETGEYLTEVRGGCVCGVLISCCRNVWRLISLPVAKFA